MKTKKLLLVAMAALLMGSSVACSKQEAPKKEMAEKKEEKKEMKEEKKEEMKMEKASDEEKAEAIKNLEAQKALELEVPNLKDSEKSTIENKFKMMIDQIKEDKISKKDVLAISAGAKNYVEGVMKAREAK